MQLAVMSSAKWCKKIFLKTNKDVQIPEQHKLRPWTLLAYSYLGIITNYFFKQAPYI